MSATRPWATLGIDVTDFGFRGRLGARRAPLWEGPQRSGSLDAARDAVRAAAEMGMRIRNAARLHVIGPLAGGADADMAGVAWIDSSDTLYLGIQVPHVSPGGCEDPCGWVKVSS